MFGFFGELVGIEIKEEDEDFALITFKDYVSAYQAQQALNDYLLAKYNARLVVKWMPRSHPS